MVILCVLGLLLCLSLCLTSIVREHRETVRGRASFERYARAGRQNEVKHG